MSLEAQQFDSVMFFGDRFLLRQDKVADFFVGGSFPKRAVKNQRNLTKIMFFLRNPGR